MQGRMHAGSLSIHSQPSCSALRAIRSQFCSSNTSLNSVCRHRQPDSRGRAVLSMAKSENMKPIMVNSCSGKMGHATAEAVVRAGLVLVPYSFTGESGGMAVGTIGVSGLPVELITPEKRQQSMEAIQADYPGVIIIDYTLPSAVNSNAQFYCANGVPFVMGTTGGDREKLLADVAEAGVPAVIAPQMGKQVVAFQATMELMAQQFPGAFTGYKLKVVESHQRTKVDTSGTAKAIIASFRQLGIPFEENEIERVRDQSRQLDMMGVPEANLDGHAFHTYSLTSPDGSVFLSFTHNVCGREIYAEGSVDAALFLSNKVRGGEGKKIFDMVDVLREGSMR